MRFEFRRLLAAALSVTVMLMLFPVTVLAEEAAPQLFVQMEQGYPGAVRKLHLHLEHNPGIAALGARITLPEILTPQCGEDGYPAFAASDALSGGYLETAWNPENRQLSLVYATDTLSAAADLLGSFTVTVSADAPLLKPTEIRLEADSLILSEGAPQAAVREQSLFVPTEPEIRFLSDSHLTLEHRNENYPLSLTPAPQQEACVWTSSDPEIASVDETGTVTPHKDGSCEIIAECETRRYVCKVTVSLKPEIAVKQFTVGMQGDTVQASLVPVPEEPVRWYVNEGEQVASVTEDGLVTVNRCGSFALFAAYGDQVVSAGCTAYITRSLNYESAEITENQPLLLTLTPMPDGPVNWEADAGEVVSVSQEGAVTPLKNGQTAVRVWSLWDDVFYTCQITVNVPPQLNLPEYAAREAGETVQLAVQFGEGVPVWTSSDSTVAAVDENGLVTVAAEGEAIITAQLGEQTCTCRVILQPFLRGDSNLDGTVSIEDAAAALQSHVAVSMVGLSNPLGALNSLAADVNLDGKVDMADAHAILIYHVMSLTGLTPEWDEILKA